MGLLIDLHLHTRRHSACSIIDESKLIDRAVRAGLDGLVITEHHYQWSRAELDDLLNASAHPGFILLAAFEYSSARGDILIYGLEPEQVREFPPGGEPERVLAKAQRMGAACIAAHPTRAAIPFDERIVDMPFEALEIRSVNLAAHEQRLAEKLARDLGRAMTTSSDAHRLEDVGRYATEFLEPIQGITDLQNSLRRGTFRPYNPAGRS
jgi:predicted metal-dependent phosphoesterase TrpH